MQAITLLFNWISREVPFKSNITFIYLAPITTVAVLYVYEVFCIIGLAAGAPSAGNRITARLYPETFLPQEHVLV